MGSKICTLTIACVGTDIFDVIVDRAQDYLIQFINMENASTVVGTGDHVTLQAEVCRDKAQFRDMLFDKIASKVIQNNAAIKCIQIIAPKELGFAELQAELHEFYALLLEEKFGIKITYKDFKNRAISIGDYLCGQTIVKLSDDQKSVIDNSKTIEDSSGCEFGVPIIPVIHMEQLVPWLFIFEDSTIIPQIAEHEFAIYNNLPISGARWILTEDCKAGWHLENKVKFVNTVTHIVQAAIDITLKPPITIYIAFRTKVPWTESVVAAISMPILRTLETSTPDRYMVKYRKTNADSTEMEICIHHIEFGLEYGEFLQIPQSHPALNRLSLFSMN